ncbi:hypothetical protein [Fructobacillus evanidus]|uniref:beta strand repeat-containing protein n=1 Tax=Fructobacillus evanidus TaxID=3064281 RepID=UPI0030C89584
MRKVKSQWVVVSLASFGLLAGVTAVQRVSADTTTATTTQPAATTSQTAGTSSSGSSTASTSASTSSSTSASLSVSTSTSLSASTSVSVSASASTSTSVSASAAGKSGSNSANVGTSTSNSGTSAASAGATNTTSASGSAVSNSATSADNTDADTTNVTTANLLGDNAAVNLGASEVADSLASTSESETPAEQAAAQQGMEDAFQGKANASSSELGQAVDYYNAAYSGAQAAVTAYNSATKGQGTGTQDYTFYGNTASKKNDDGTTHDTTGIDKSGTPQAYGSADDVNQGGADNPAEASASASKYETALNTKLDAQTNVSVQTTTSNSTTNNISIPTSQTASIANARTSYQSDTNLGASFDAGVAYALGQLGQEDAESGKWQGVYSGSNGGTKDQYLATATNDTSNPYDQAYRGALAAMNSYFDGNDNYKGNTAVSVSLTANTYFDQGFNDVVNQAKNGIAYVQNGSQFASVLTGSTDPTHSGNVASGINTIRLANDVNLTNSALGETQRTETANTSSFTIDGQNHLMDFGGLNYTVNSASDLYLQNFQTIYGSSDYGPFAAGSGAVHFGNLNYVGPQLLSAYGNDVYFFGNVNVISPDNTSNTYTSPFHTGVSMDGSGVQENLEVNNFILQAGAHYFGTTSPVGGGNNIIAKGNFTVDTGAKMTLVSRGQTPEDSQDDSAFGIILDTSGASLNIKKDATVNIIPGHYSGSATVIGGGILATGSDSINIDGGTLNYEGENGVSGNYNEPIDMYSSGNSINVINGGLLQALLDSMPTQNATDHNGTSYYGIVSNPHNGTFNVGSKGSLKIGYTNSDWNNSVPYFGDNFNINSVGGTHVIMIKPTNAQAFQTDAGTDDDALGGSINAYTVAITQSNGTKQYLYYFNLPSGSTTYTGTDLNGDSVTGKISGNTLDIANVPAVQVVGPLTTAPSSTSGMTTVTGFVKLTNYEDMDNSKYPLYVSVATGTNAGTNGTSFDQLNQITGDNLKDGYSSADPYTYTTSVSTQGYAGGLLKVVYDIPTADAKNYIGMRFHYGINSVSTILNVTGSSYTTTVEGFTPDSSHPGKVVQDTTHGDMVVANGSTGNVENGIQDGITDAENNNSAKKAGEPFDTQTNDDYISGYKSAQAGYKAYSNQTANQDYTQTDAYKNASNPDAFTQGYNAAAYDAGLHDAKLGQTNSKDSNYTQAQTEYNTVYTAALDNPNETLSNILSSATIPVDANLKNTTPTPAENQAFTDAQGVAAFVKDEQAGNISGTTYGPNFNALTTNDQKVAYEAALTGYNQAMTVSPTSDDPDGNATKAEIAGFEYGQSLINGGLSTGTVAPTAAASHMNNVNVAQIGYNTANQAVTAAKGNGSSSTEAQTANAQSLPADSGTTDATFDRYVKYGAYAALKGNSDTGLNQYEEVGYSKVITASAYQDGLNAYKNKQSATPTGTDAESNAGQTSFAQGYSDGQKAAAAGIQNFKNGTAQPTGTDTISYITSQAQASAQQGFADGDAGKSAPSTDTSYDSAYTTGYNAGQSTKLATDDAKNGTDQSKSANDSAAYSDAKGAYADGASAYKSGNTQSSKSADPVYQAAYNQALADITNARTQAIQDADGNHGQAKSSSTSYSANQDAESVAEKAYTDAQTAYSEAIVGAATPTNPNDAQASGAAAGANDKAYIDATVANQTTTATVSSTKSGIVTTQIGAAQAAFTANPDALDTLNSTDPLANYAYKAEMDSLKAQYAKGINDAATGKNPDATASDAEKKGASDYAAGLNAAVNGPAITNPTTGNKDGEAAANSYNAGYNDAKAGTPNDSNSGDPVKKSAYEGASEAFTDVANGTTRSTDSMDPVQKVAYEQALKEAQADAAQGAQDFVNGKDSPNASTVSGAAAAEGYKQAQSGYSDGQSGKSSQSDDPNYTTGYNAGKSETSGYNDQTAPTNATPTEQQAYDGAKAGAADGIAGKKQADNSAQSKAYQDAYTKAYQDAQTGYPAGYAAGQGGGTPAEPNNPSYMAGYHAGQAAKQATTDAYNGVNNPSGVTDQTTYKDVQDGYHDGVIATGKTLNNTPDATTGDAPYKTAYHQGIVDTNAARAKAMQAADANYGQANSAGTTYSANKDVETIAEQAYTDAQNAYNATMINSVPTSPNDAQQSGITAAQTDQSYVQATVANPSQTSTTVSATKTTAVNNGITKAQADFKANPDASDSLSGSDALTTYAYKVEMDSLHAQYNTGKQEAAAGNSPATTASDAEKQGAIDYTNGLNAAVNNDTQSIANPTSGNKAGEAAIDSFNKGYQDAVDGKDDSTLTDPVQKAAQAAIDSFNKGYQDAVDGKDDSTLTDPVQKAAQAAASEGFADVTSGNVKNATEIATMNPVAQVAYQKAVKEAQADAAQGAQTYLSGGSRPADNTVAGKAEASGYDKAQQGYTDEQSNKTQASSDPSYTTGYNAGKSEQSGYNDKTQPASTASQSEQDAYNGAQAGSKDAIAGNTKNQNTGKSQAYKDGYNQGYDDATGGYTAGYNAGQNGTKPNATQTADPSYMKGYNAGQAAKQAIADDQNGQSNASGVTDQTTYDDAQKGYHDGVIATGKTGVNTPDATAANGDQPYQAGYNQAITDTNKARAAAYQDADDNHGQAIDSNKKYSPNSDIQTVAQQAYNDAQTAYSEAISGATTPTNPNDAQASGVAAGTNDKSYVDATVANQTPSATVSSAKSTIVSAQITAAQTAFNKDPDAPDSLNSTDPLANYAYKAEMDSLQSRYSTGKQ